MKTNSLFGIVLGAALCLSSCEKANVKMHTTIYEDGSCEREVSYSNIMSKEMRDSVWEKGSTGWSQPMPECLNIEAFNNSHTEIGEGDTVTTTFSCRFPSVERMCEENPLQLNGTRLKSQAKLEKHFRWFYTEYTFTEVFDCVGDTFKIAPTNYADKDVVSFWFTGQPNLIEGLSGAEASEKLSNMEPFVSKWLNDNFYQVCFDYIVNHYDSVPNPPVSREQFIELHDSLANFLLKGQDDILKVNAAETMRSFFNSDAYAQFFNEQTPCGKELNQELAHRLNIFWFNVPYTLSMPGTVVDAGTGVCRDGIVYYAFTGERLIPHDYVISATSRVTNIWAYIVTLLIILLAIGSFFYRKRNHQ